MNKEVQLRRGRSPLTIPAAIATLSIVMFATGCASGGDEGGGDGEDVTIEFMQWWEPELPEGSLQSLVDRFEEENPGIRVELLSGPNASIKDQLVTASASGTMPDVMGMDGTWVYDFAQQGTVANLTEQMESAGYDDSQLAAQVEVDGATYMIPAVNFAYPMFVNNDLLTQAGIDSPPTTRSEFLEAAKAITDETDASGFVTALGLERANGVQIDILPWMWASGGSMLTEDGGPDATNGAVVDAVDFIKEMWDEGVIAPGGLTMAEQDKVEEFTNGRVGMMVSSLAHINLLKENAPALDFSVIPVPVEDGYTGESGVRYASWGLSMSAGSEHPEESWKLIEFLMSEDVNAELSGFANGFPGNKGAEPDLSDADPRFQDAYDIWTASTPEGAFSGLPQAGELMRIFDVHLQEVLAEGRSVDEAVADVQKEWSAIF